eukprot:CAMPEP_0177421542 /NCGR_PEP_ID=MMETSP0368-20130122/70839_1 /TAXON_ID=447022 ORGANISM="Scrippsiella hangoei-like, Strain SHHI-4" /NCGR_SAMPLE_ID=MMETSP0368 /ASSEMBLY_ACC=CAM_ASM_000363 /LENGTH=70 /DNA_ID=CAMNT_0018891397 /DNA_START=230 /DNA_END=442 /DNA_ORIENTATION=-
MEAIDAMTMATGTQYTRGLRCAVLPVCPASSWHSRASADSPFASSVFGLALNACCCPAALGARSLALLYG